MAVLENSRHEMYCQNRVNIVAETGKEMSQRQAYLNAFPQSKNWKNETVDKRACELEKTGEVQGRLQELREATKKSLEESEKYSILNRQERMQVLSDIASNSEERTDARIKAIDTMNKMDGEYINNVKIEGNIKNPFEGLTTAQLAKLAGECD